MPRLLKPLLAALLLLACVAPTASAGTYTIHSCRTPDGQFNVADGWLPSGDYAKAITCLEPFPQFPDARFIGINGGSESGGKGQTAGFYSFAAPEGTTIVKYVMFRSTQVSTKTQNGSTWATGVYEADQALDPNRTTDLCFGGAGCAGRGVIDRPLDGANRIEGPQTAGTTRILSITAGCANADCPGDAAQANFQLHRADITLDDPSAPAFTSPPTGGLLASNRTVTGPETITVNARDTGSGVERAVLEVDGKALADRVVDENDGGCRRPFVRRVPCRLQAGTTLSADLAKLPDGPHSVRVLAVDAAGNATATAPATVTSRNPATACGPSAPGPRVEASFSRGRRTLRARPSASTRLTGRLRDAGGAPIAGAPIRLLVRDDRTGAATTARDGVATGADGRFAVTVGRGASRRLRLAYRADTEGTLRCSRLLRIAVPAPVSISLSARRLQAPGTLVIRGRLTRGPVPRGGKLVDLQAFDRGKWRTFETTRASERSRRFTARLRFGRAARAGSYRIRARVRREAGYPYALGYSKPKRLVLR